MTTAPETHNAVPFQDEPLEKSTRRKFDRSRSFVSKHKSKILAGSALTVLVGVSAALGRATAPDADQFYFTENGNVEFDELPSPTDPADD